MSWINCRMTKPLKVHSFAAGLALGVHMLLHPPLEANDMRNGQNDAHDVDDFAPEMGVARFESVDAIHSGALGRELDDGGDGLHYRESVQEAGISKR